MDYLISSLLATKPTGLWEKIIMAFEEGFGTFALSIIVLTIIIKLIMSPVDFFNRRTNKKMATMQKKIQSQVDAINKKYANDPKTKNQKLGELYQKEKINPTSSCIVMLVNLVLTLTIFITLLNGMNTMASYKIANEFENLQIEYVAEYVQTTYNKNIYDEISENSDKSVYEICKTYIDEINAMNETEKTATINKANENVAKKYKEIKEGFLWIDNIWMADSPMANSVPAFENFATVARLTKDEKADENYKAVYEQIMNPLRESSGRANGYFILLILCAGLSFLNQYLMTKKQKKENPQMPTNKAMLIIMPLIMAVFTLFYTTMFSLYLVTSQAVSIGLTPLIDLVSDKIDKKKLDKESEVIPGRMQRVVVIKDEQEKEQSKQKKSNKKQKDS